MYVEVFLIAAIVLTLLGLVRSTEAILDVRQRQRDQGHDPKLYL